MEKKPKTVWGIVLKVIIAVARLQRDALRCRFPGRGFAPLPPGAWLCRHRLPLLRHPRWRGAPLPSRPPHRCPCRRLERPQHRHLLRRRSGRAGPACRHPHLRPEVCAPRSAPPAEGGLSARPHPGPPPAQPVYPQGLSVLRRGGGVCGGMRVEN